MSAAQARYESIRTTAEQAVRLIRDGDTISVPIGAGEPPEILEALSALRRDLRGVTVQQLLPIRPLAYFDPATVDHIRHCSLFLGGPARAGAREGWIDVIPAHFSDIPGHYRRGTLPVDVVVTVASPMDEHGYFAVGLSPAYTMAAIEKARVVVLEVNPQAPFTNGDCHVHVSQVSAVVESSKPLAATGIGQIGPIEQAIASFVTELIPDGATLQIGIGAIPDAVVAQLQDKNDLGIHSEMFGDGIRSLCESGVVTNLRKNVHHGKSIAAFAFGSPALYSFLHRNPAVEMHPVDVVNTPHLAGLNDDLHAINGSMAIDLAGQCGSESIGPVPYSGSGGQADFVRAAGISRGGKSFIVLPATAKGGTMSRIVPTLAPGTHVTTHKNEVDYVVTEFGIAQLRGRSLRDRARMLIEIAHPDFRDELTATAKAMHLA